jgi:hypothetical protein
MDYKLFYCFWPIAIPYKPSDLKTCNPFFSLSQNFTPEPICLLPSKLLANIQQLKCCQQWHLSYRRRRRRLCRRRRLPRKN